MKTIEPPYAALALQMNCTAVNALSDRAAVETTMMATLDRVNTMIKGSKAFIATFSGHPVRLVVLPEYFLTGFPMGESIQGWRDKACIAIDGPEYQHLGRIAQSNAIYLSGNAYEIDPHFPELYFQTSFVVDDSGEVILRYRRLVSMFAPTPHDVLSRYLDIYGPDALFPVVDTPLGRLACVASEEILYPEITRAHSLKGAEVILHSSSEVGSPQLTAKNIAKRARAYENMCYVISANTSAITGSPVPENSTQGHSQVVDYRGQVMAEAYCGESMVANSCIDIERLRDARRQPAMTNMLARQRPSLFADSYATASHYPANNLLDEQGAVKTPDRQHFMSVQQDVINHLVKEGMM